MAVWLLTPARAAQMAARFRRPRLHVLHDHNYTHSHLRVSHCPAPVGLGDLPWCLRRLHLYHHVAQNKSASLTALRALVADAGAATEAAQPGLGVCKHPQGPWVPHLLHTWHCQSCHQRTRRAVCQQTQPPCFPRIGALQAASAARALIPDALDGARCRARRVTSGSPSPSSRRRIVPRSRPAQAMRSHHVRCMAHSGLCRLLEGHFQCQRAGKRTASVPAGAVS